MIYKTYGALREEIEREVDTEEEEFVQPDELMAYTQDAVNEAAAHIHKLGLEDDYFLKRVQYSLTVGQTSLQMPADIYITKIRSLLYSTPEKTYQIKKIKGKDRFEMTEFIKLNSTSGEYYRFQMMNDSDAGYVAELIPQSYEDRANCITLYYIREAVQIVDDNSLIDIPQFYYFIKAFVKWKILDKEGNPRAAEARAEKMEAQQLMLETLAEMVPDYDSEIPQDLSNYEEHT